MKSATAYLCVNKTRSCSGSKQFPSDRYPDNNSEIQETDPKQFFLLHLLSEKK